MAEFLSKWLIKQRKPNINCIGLWLVPNLKSSGVKSSEPITHRFLSRTWLPGGAETSQRALPWGRSKRIWMHNSFQDLPSAAGFYRRFLYIKPTSRERFIPACLHLRECIFH